ncbi:MAG: hypothetical protein ABIT04_07055 [Novosphingobium sp.]
MSRIVGPAADRIESRPVISTLFGAMTVTIPPVAQRAGDETLSFWLLRYAFGRQLRSRRIERAIPTSSTSA